GKPDQPEQHMSPSEDARISDRPEEAPHADAAPRRKRGLVRSAAQAVGTFVQWVVLMPLVLFRAKRRALDEITVYSAHPSFFLWLLIAVGFSLAAIVRHVPAWAGVLGWVYIWVLLYFFITLLYDFSTRKLALWVLIFTLLWLTSKYIEHL